MILALLLAAGVTFQPAAPTVGDPVTITFPARVTLEKAQNYEVLSNDGTHVVVRTFLPAEFEVRGTAEGQPVRVRIPVKSVLGKGDLLAPAPLTPPRPLPYPRAPFVFIGLAASRKADVEKFLKKNPFSYTIVPDATGIILTKFGTPDKDGQINVPFPMHLVLDRDGNAVVQVQGKKGIEAGKKELTGQVSSTQATTK